MIFLCSQPFPTSRHFSCSLCNTYLLHVFWIRRYFEIHFILLYTMITPCDEHCPVLNAATKKLGFLKKTTSFLRGNTVSLYMNVYVCILNSGCECLLVMRDSKLRDTMNLKRTSWLLVKYIEKMFRNPHY